MKAIRRHARLPAIRLVCSTLALCAMGALWTPAGAQTALTVAAEGRTAPGGTAVVAIRAGTKVAIVSTKETSALVTIEGWVDASRLAAKVDTFPASVDSKAPLRIRASASDKAPIIAELRQRVGVRTLGKSGTWTRIRRSAWIPASALPKTAASVAAPKPSAPRAPPSVPPKIAPPVAAPQAESVASPPATTSAPMGAMSVTKATKLLTAPGGAAIADVPAGAVVQTLTHDHGFVKVRVEGWLPERELSSADNAVGTQLTAADLRADPEGTRGKLVQWEVEVLSLQIADPLRRELARDEPYLLAKGPGTENALLYLAVPPSLLTQAKALPPLTRVLITARVRAGHSEPVGVPILDLRSISKR